MYFLQKLKRELITFFSRTCVRAARNDYLGLDLRYPIIYGMGRGYVIPKELTMGYLLEAFVNSKKGAVVDVGANVGVYLVKLRAIDAKREYVGFEPNAICVHYVNELVRMNRFDNCRVLPLALGARREIAVLDAKKLGDKTGSVISGDNHQVIMGEYAQSAISMPGDEALKWVGIKEVSVIKIDVEGGELAVLQGLKRTLELRRPYVYVEIWRNIGTEKIRIILEMMQALNYSVMGLVSENRLAPVSDLSGFDGQYDPNYVLVPEEDRNMFMDSLAATSIRII